MSFDEILSDRTHGSTYLIKQYLELISQGIETSQLSTMNQKLQSTFADMAIVQNVTNELESASEPIKMAMKIQMELDEFVSVIADKIRKNVNNSRILTYSNSQTVIDVLNQLEPVEIKSMLSLPGGEGKDLAEKVGSEILADMAALSKLSDFDFVLIGCDCYSDTKVINKLGTKVLAELCNLKKIPILALTSKYKYLPSINTVTNPMFEVINRSDLQLIAA